ncbi:MAG: hypothetical protein AAF658_08645 [Myxococcota bacterium]
MNRTQRRAHRLVFTVLAPLLLGLVIYALVTRADPHRGADRIAAESRP